MSTPRDRRKRDKDVGGKPDGRGEKPQTRQKPKPDTTLPQTDEANRQMYERTLYMTLNLVGRVVQVQVKSGAIYEGIFHTAQADKGFGVVLLMARKREQGSTILGPATATIIIQGKDFVQMTAKDVTFNESVDASDEVFMTDTDISGHIDKRERELQRWVPDGDVTTELNFNADNRTEWDQFAENEKLFGVTTTYEEEIYTTKLDKGSSKYAELSRKAQRIADEIEGKVANNAHLAEERGQIGLDDMDEEEKYSSVIRSGVYVPPAKRAQQQQEKQQQQQTAHVGENNNRDKANDLNTSSELQMPVNTTTGGGEDELRQSAGSPLSPSMTPLSPKDKFTSTSVADRLKLRRALVNETHRTTSPTPASGSDASGKPQSPLHSPLVGDPKTITALGLEPRAPAVAEGVAREFLNFSLTKQNPPSSRQSVTADLKNFSLNFSKRPGSPATHGSAPSSPGPVTAAQASDASKTSPAPSTASTTAPPSTTTPVATTPAPAASSASAASAPATPTSSASSTSSTSSSTTAPTLRPLTSKLNPNAKAFTPMSANAPVFTPKGFVPTHPAPAPIMSPVEHGPVFFHPGPGPMQPHPHHGPPPPHAAPPPHLQPPPPSVVSAQTQAPPPQPIPVDPRPISEIYCDAMKRKTHQEKSEATQPYWFGTRGPYRTNVEDMDPNLRPPQTFPPPPHGAPPLAPLGVMHPIPLGVGPGSHPAHPHALQPNPGMPMGPNFPPPYVGVIPNAPMGIVMNMGPPPVPMPVGGPGPQPQVVAGPIFMGQPGMRPYPHPGAPIAVGMAPGQPPYVAYPQMTPLSPPVSHQPPPSQSPSSSSAQSPPPPHTSPTPTSPPPQPPYASPHASPHPTSPTPLSHPSSPHPTSPTPSSPSPMAAKQQRAFYPHSPQSPHPSSPSQAAKSGYTPQTHT